ncbi:2-keto-4-pentenoate hydratase/2-oxohepta-3-ene-1,7-dioic acid hydratase in catechol pathway [Rhizobium aethiopicum]|uniref:2-keto-4-pentenoate hydratase/2-oxohepta-3-ene-1,7-dioic acid hydratase in catechol pathway n=1 Tax=Rhizobium aethiopicum TaxID=1138170 RepID=A0A7W6QBG5_9HYPH|nr:fumarylacetoacetate hydrolase family protein [Rhizobium aethiopicum]MBB4194461.1 2-keto-4-pentenoate hydratase/2-oxohepta-3-ene-1,7-dioic acid hydratase in catechol pathway [Rhizobium aethiopicum]MBB4582144.1 2-keto-4-pentenoate hydratase/2-oxohepta-3-ene-1,7-dioic acid hydratase in catechol pathway [Rhizobium aethiopicum]
MQFLSYTRLGIPGFGVRVENGIVDLTGKIRPGVTNLRQAIHDNCLEEAADFAAGRYAEFTEADVTLLPVIPDPGKILCVGLNYETHRAETKRPDAKYPTIFTRFADTQVAHRQPLLKPRVSDSLDFEAELAVVIGRGGRYIAQSAAMDHVAGYACYNDATVRDWQRHTFQFTPGKNFPSTGAFGPQLVTPDEVGDYMKLRILGRLNGEVMQEATLADLIFPIATLISYCSQFTPLQPGDVILTGTPGGVGDRREPPLYMKAGDIFEVEIPGVGRLTNPIVVEP